MGNVHPLDPERGSTQPNTLHMITSLDGSIHFRAEAKDTAEALDKLAQHLDYPDFQSMCADLDYSVSNFSIATITDERGSYNDEGERIDLKQERVGVVKSAFKHLRRLGQ